MGLSKKWRERISDDAVAGRIAGAIIGAQQKLASYLNRKVEMLQGRTLLFMLIAFCSLFGSYCLYLIINACN